MTVIDEKNPRDVASAVAAIASESADTPAVIDATGRVNYADFDIWSNDLANRINNAIGLAPQVCLVVGGFDRQAVVAMIATMKTPHAFVALDRENLPANISAIAAELEAGLVVYTDAAEDVVRAAVLDLPTLSVGPLPEGPVSAPVAVSDRTRVLTLKRSSGSTGNAKTVALSADAILADAKLGAQANKISSGAAYGLISTFDSAMSGNAIMRCILAGGTLMPVDLRFENPKRALDRLTADGLTHLHATPTAFRLLTQGLAEGAIFPDVHTVFLSGEKTTPADVRLIAKTTKPSCKLRAAFSSTETQMVAFTTVTPSQDPDLEDFAELTLLPGVSIDILDEAGHPTPAGVLGRVRISGKLIALGYRGTCDPEAAAKFATDETGTRSYMTDDMGFLTEEGKLVLTSRAGREVKIRGRRVDLGELETWLTRQNDIAEAAVVVQPLGQDGSPRIAAFIKGETDFSGPSVLRKRMQADLIASMQPTAIVLVDELPRTPNQKINRRALEGDLSHLDAEGSETLQDDGLLGQVAQIWARVLNRPVTGKDKDFFDLGGDSIAATVAAMMLEETLGLPIDTGFVYRYPILAEQVVALEQVEDGGGLQDRLLVPLTRSPAGDTGTSSGRSHVFIIPGAYGFVLPFGPLAQELLPKWDMVGILHPDLSRTEPELHSVEEFADRMSRAIRAFQPEGPYLIVGYSFGGAVAHEIGRRLGDAGEKAAIVLLDTRIPKLMTLFGKANLVRRDVKTWWAGRKDGAGAFQVTANPFRDLTAHEPGMIEQELLPVSFTRAFRILAKYRPDPTACPTILIKSDELRSRFDADDFGWSRVAPLVKTSVARGEHGDIFKEPNLEPFTEMMRQSLEILEERVGLRASAPDEATSGRATKR